MRRVVAAHPGTPPATLGSLSAETDDAINQALAFNSATPTNVLVELAGRSVDLALLVALNPDAPDGILRALAEDDDSIVHYFAQEVLASRPALTGERSAAGALDEVTAV